MAINSHDNRCNGALFTPRGRTMEEVVLTTQDPIKLALAYISQPANTAASRWMPPKSPKEASDEKFNLPRHRFRTVLFTKCTF